MRLPELLRNTHRLLWYLQQSHPDFHKEDVQALMSSIQAETENAYLSETAYTIEKILSLGYQQGVWQPQRAYIKAEEAVDAAIEESQTMPCRIRLIGKNKFWRFEQGKVVYAQ